MDGRVAAESCTLPVLRSIREATNEANLGEPGQLQSRSARRASARLRSVMSELR